MHRAVSSLEYDYRVAGVELQYFGHGKRDQE